VTAEIKLVVEAEQEVTASAEELSEPAASAPEAEQEKEAKE